MRYLISLIIGMILMFFIIDYITIKQKLYEVSQKLEELTDSDICSLRYDVDYLIKELWPDKYKYQDSRIDLVYYGLFGQPDDRDWNMYSINIYADVRNLENKVNKLEDEKDNN